MQETEPFFMDFFRFVRVSALREKDPMSDIALGLYLIIRG